MRCLVVLPTYDEADNIAAVLRRLRVAVPTADILVIDDSSPDGTATIARAVGHDVGAVDVLVRPGKSGLGTAYRTGFQAGLHRGYDVLVEMDSDLSHDPAALPALLHAVEQGCDLAIGSRYVPGGAIPDWPRHRRWLSRWGNRYASFALDISVLDATSGFRAYSAQALRRIDLETIRAGGYGFQVEMTYRMTKAGARVVELPIEFIDRQHGTSKMSVGIAVEAIVLVTWWGLRDRVLVRRTQPDQAQKASNAARSSK